MRTVISAVAHGRQVAFQAAKWGGHPFEQAALSRLVEITAGMPEVVVGLVDGTVDIDHPDLAHDRLRALPSTPAGCTSRDASCVHGTFVAGLLASRRTTESPGICPGCTFLLRPVFGADTTASTMPSATPHELAAAMLECIENGARVVNVSATLTASRADDQGGLSRVLDLAARRDVLVVVAGGNQALITGSALTRHPWALPVIAHSRSGRPMPDATLGASIGRRGVGAPGDEVLGLAPGGRKLRLSGSSVAAPYATGTAALLWSEFPDVPAGEIRWALTAGGARRARGVAPPPLDAWVAYRRLAERWRR